MVLSAEEHLKLWLESVLCKAAIDVRRMKSRKERDAVVIHSVLDQARDVLCHFGYNSTVESDDEDSIALKVNFSTAGIFAYTVRWSHETLMWSAKEYNRDECDWEPTLMTTDSLLRGLSDWLEVELVPRSDGLMTRLIAEGAISEVKKDVFVIGRVNQFSTASFPEDVPPLFEWEQATLEEPGSQCCTPRPPQTFLKDILPAKLSGMRARLKDILNVK